jgi:hypothetical protein
LFGAYYGIVFASDVIQRKGKTLLTMGHRPRYRIRKARSCPLAAAREKGRRRHLARGWRGVLSSRLTTSSSSFSISLKRLDLIGWVSGLFVFNFESRAPRSTVFMRLPLSLPLSHTHNTIALEGSLPSRISHLAKYILLSHDLSGACDWSTFFKTLARYTRCGQLCVFSPSPLSLFLCPASHCWSDV